MHGPCDSYANYHRLSLQAGEDRAWLAANYDKIRERATYGDQDFKAVLQEMKEREDLREEIPPTYDSATSPTSPSIPGVGSPRIGQLSFERELKR